MEGVTSAIAEATQGSMANAQSIATFPTMDIENLAVKESTNNTQAVNAKTTNVNLNPVAEAPKANNQSSAEATRGKKLDLHQRKI